jgi:hypothetical protein
MRAVVPDVRYFVMSVRPATPLLKKGIRIGGLCESDWGLSKAFFNASAGDNA